MFSYGWGDEPMARVSKMARSIIHIISFARPASLCREVCMYIYIYIYIYNTGYLLLGHLLGGVYVYVYIYIYI